MGSIGSAVSGLVTGASQAFTPQNQFQATAYQIPNQNFAQAIQQSQAGYNQNQTNQSALAQALLAQSQGHGANPAQAMLNQQTDQNIRQNAGLIASQKGINPALAQRMAAQNAAQMNQQAAGQGAVMGAQQQLAAQQGLGALYGQQGNQNLNYQQILQGAQANQNQANIQQNLGLQSINAGVAAGNARANQNTSSGLLSGLGGAGAQSMLGSGGGGGAGMAAMAAAHGGMVPGYADGGTVLNYDPNGIFGRELSQMNQQMAPLNPLVMNMKMPASSSPQGTPMAGGPDAQDLNNMNMMASSGGNVPGKAKAQGDSSQNDTVPAMLSPGEIVVPRSKASDVDKAKEFVEQLIKRKKGEKGDGSGSYSKVLEAHRKLGEQLKSMGA